MDIAAMERAWDLEDVPDMPRRALFHAYLVAARAGRIEAMTNVGLHLMYGDGVQRDAGQALRWLKKAVAQGDSVAAFNLGLFYEQGTQIRKNRRLAENWYRRAVAIGLSEAQSNLANLLFASPIPSQWAEAVILYRASARRGSAAAIYSLATAYEQGKGVKQSLERAIRLYEKAANLEDVNAQCTLGWLLLNGARGSPDYLGAIRWYQRAAKQGSTSAFFSLGQIYSEGLGVPKSKTRAVQHFRSAASAGHSKAAERLRQLGEPL
ncbi:sel1 repeat family protein [Myxococcus sp. K38C18041901]|uniref:tetratricopeptide repeat protein n=1 Tax=Myxococcus guangdongensis TaxID=2906760 RepID=UPI0020A6F48A|nr:tetratricopeptide repeat protein [Myxococcus guangdongensis]MCP3059575.1 sel1 repeat family protein [Myxococcus guangdongensis]